MYGTTRFLGNIRFINIEKDFGIIDCDDGEILVFSNKGLHFEGGERVSFNKTPRKNFVSETEAINIAKE